MWLVLGHAGDVTAAWCAVALRRAGLDDVEVVLAEELIVGASLRHRVSSSDVSTEVSLRDGRVLDSDRVDGVVNRLLAMPPGPDIADGDRAYVQSERTAATVSWLGGLRGPVLNRPSAHSLHGRWLRPAEWQLLAGLVGLPAAGWTTAANEAAGDGHVRVLVVGDEVVWPDGSAAQREPELDARLTQLAACAELRLCDVLLAPTDRGPAVVGGSAVPDVRSYGDGAADALARYLARAAA